MPLNRKMLSDIASLVSAGFKTFVEIVKKARAAFRSQREKGPRRTGAGLFSFAAEALTASSDGAAGAAEAAGTSRCDGGGVAAGAAAGTSGYGRDGGWRR